MCVAKAMLGMALGAALAGAAQAQPADAPLSGLTGMLTACAAGEACILVDSVPCGCASGGSHVAINGRYGELWQEIQRYLKSHPPPMLCAQIYRCDDHAAAVCREGRCQVVSK